MRPLEYTLVVYTIAARRKKMEWEVTEAQTLNNFDQHNMEGQRVNM